MINKIKELRKILPIPITEAKLLLENNESDVEKCIYLFKAKCIKQICEETGCEEKMANRYYEAEKHDLNRAISAVKEEIYDLNYKPIDGLTIEDLCVVNQWINLIEAEDFAVSLDYKLIERVIKTLLLIPSMHETGQMVAKAKLIKDHIFKDYTDEMSIEEFVTHHKRLDEENDFQIANKIIPLRLTIIKDELKRHQRNIH